MEGTYIYAQEFNQMGETFSKILAKIYNDIQNRISSSSESKDFASLQVSFDGIFEKINDENEIEIEIGQTHYSYEPFSNRIQELRAKIEQIASDISMIKLRFKEVIDMAGEICQNDLATAENINPVKTKSPEHNTEITRLSISNNYENLETMTKYNLETEIISKITECNTINSSMIKIKQNEVKTIDSSRQLQLKCGSLSISIENESDEIKQFKRELIYNELVLKLYSSLCKEESLPNNQKLMVYKKDHPKGIAVKLVSDSYTYKGFAKDCCINDLYYEDLKGSQMIGKMVKGFIFGKGSYRLDNGKLFQGEIFENFTAHGEMFDGNIKTVGVWNITGKGNTYSFTISGHFKRYIDNILDSEGIHEGDMFKGTVYKPEGVVLTGTWMNGTFQNVKISKDNRVTELIRHSEVSHSEITYEDSVLVYRFTIVNDKKEGDGYFKTEEGEEVVRFEDGNVVWGKVTKTSRIYEGFIQDNLYHGKGRLETDLFIYSGEFEKGIFHGQGLFNAKTEKSSLCGIFNNGRMIKGVVEIQSQRYEGSLNASEEAEGYGIITTPDYRYEGEWKAGKFHGTGTFEDLKAGSKKKGIFEDGNLVSGKMVIGQKKWKGNFNAAGEADGKCRFDSPEISYDGHWKNDKFHGQGIMEKKKQGEVLTGRFENNYIAEGELVKGQVGYRGNFKSGQPHGCGTIITPDFTYYGEFSNGNMNGKGRKILKDGTLLEGIFENGALINGRLDCTEFIYTGAFKDGNMNGNGSLVINGIIYKGSFLNGEHISGTVTVNGQVQRVN